ncbi:A-kinase-interacting protein 1 isoform X2 [Halichoerus grypus]
MENCLAAAALNGVDRRALQRTARLGQEVLERAKRRAVDWHSRELPKSGVGVTSRERPYRERRPAAGPQRLLPGEREERQPTLSASFRTMAEFMDYTSSQCGTICLPSIIPVPSVEILFICAGGRRGGPRLSVSQREVGAAPVLGQWGRPG